MAVALPFIGLASTAFGIGTKILGGIAGANSQKAAIQYQMAVAKNNMHLARYNAQMAEQQGEARATAEGLKGRAAYGALMASEAGSGVDVNSGSFVSARDTEARLNQLDAMTIKSDYAREVYGYNNEYKMYREQRQLLRRSQPTMLQTILGLGGTALGGASQLGSQVSGGLQSGALPDLFGGGNSSIDLSSMAGAASPGGVGGLEPGMIGTLPGIF